MEKNERLALWAILVKKVEEGIASMSTDQDVAEALTIGLPMLLATVEDGFCQEVKQDAKRLVILMIDAMGKNGLKLKAGSPVEALYNEYKTELQLCPTDNHVYTPLPSMFENLTLDQILNAPRIEGLPNN